MDTEKVIFNYADGEGYAVEAWSGNTLLERREGGDCFTDNSTKGTLDIVGKDLRGLALYAAELMCIKYKLKCDPKLAKDLRIMKQDGEK
jgi:hypothetical protein